MATITLGDSGIDQRQETLLVGEVVTFNSSLIEIQSADGSVFRVTGTFDAGGNGTITGYAFYMAGGAVQFEVSGLNLSTVDYYTYANQGDISGLFGFAFGGADYLNGGSGNDVLIDTQGSDQVFGNAGTDTLVLDSSFAESLIDLLEDGTVSVSHSGETDLLEGIERLLFSDQMALAFDIEGIAGQAYRIYQAAFDRAPDQTGLGYWISQMDGGMLIEEVAARFIDSDEFRSLYGDNVDSEAFLTAVYNNVLHRDPDQGGLEWWLNEMTQGNHDYVSVLAGFSESAENQLQVSGQIADGIEFSFWGT
ncbi:DUF4214 domain-containing protein [Marinobacterium arenosum]|uniref:DUF4214 domain-containing protein n=1 Tax=Marinobacterium arenosum TaxID=2862496 RepID=UPI001C941575|nr:DUF4214 domain-containing protein [Marinobacterium arenosum]MBY4676805.1 DUF4214 domain-containing protein [Marinobacterium arenosum]